MIKTQGRANIGRALGWLFACGLVLSLGTLSIEAQEVRSKPALDRRVGTPVENFSRTDALTGKPLALADLKDQKAVVLVFMGTDCPIGNLLMPRLVELQARYRDQGVSVLAINANASERAETVAAHAREFRVNFPVLLDPGAKLADALEAQFTCESLLLDGDRVIRYRGAVDDQYDYGVRKERPVRKYLVEALDALLAGKPVENTASSVAGCPIERAVSARAPAARIQPVPPETLEVYKAIEPEIDPGAIGPVDYARHVAPLLQEKCQACHRPGQVAGFSLLSYDDARRWAAGIAQVVEERRMPPWHADPRHGQFQNDRHLTARERATLLAWVDQGTPRGDQAQEPPTRDWPENWRIGTPDLVLEIPAEYTVKPEGVLPYQRFRVKTNLTEDKWAQAIEPQPGDRTVVHHIVVYLVPPKETGRRSHGNFEHLAAYAPGDIPTVLPPGVAKKIPAGSELIIELHYTPTGKTRIDRSRIGFIFAKQQPKFQAVTIPILNQGFEIPAGAGNHEVRASFNVPSEFRVIGFLPHMHLRGKDFTYTAHIPAPGTTGHSETLLSVPRYDFAWQTYYWLKEPKLLPAGSQIECVAHFDNSTANRALTDEQTKKNVRWGEQTWEEMMIGYIDTLVPVEVDVDVESNPELDNEPTSP